MSQSYETAVQKALRSVVESFGERYVVNGLLKKDAIITDLDRYRPELIEKLLSHPLLKETFTYDIADATILKINDVIGMLEVDEYWSNSYTRYSNKIGLTANHRYLDEISDVVLDFPYKDTVLKGGMRKEDVTKEEATESFLNEVVAREEIDVLLDEKIFKNVRKYDDNGGSAVSDIKDTDNLIIKGNNLLALHSLKKRYKGSVKLIYIDPPYNTGNDSFNYNDSFNHSTWLTFMKNRLEVARELLADDGVIFVQCDDNEQAYLKVLMDEVFGQESFVATLVWANKEGGGKSDSKHFRQKHEYILVYAKQKELLEIKGAEVEDIERYRFSDRHEKTRGKYQLIKLDSGSLGWVKSLDYPIELDGRTFYAGGDYDKWLDRQNGGASIKDWGWRWSKNKLKWGLENDFIEIKQSANGKWNIYTKQYLNCDNDGNIKPRTIKPMALIEKYSNTQSNKHMKMLELGFVYSKPEGLIMDILHYATNKGDLILDFFAGSGTTAAVAHKMGRQYIGIEQMDYIETVSVERLKKVIAGEQGGISKDVNWQGGGSFIYAELMEKNATFIDAVLRSEDADALRKVFDEMKTTLDFDFRVDLQEVSTSLWEEDFETQKKILVKIIDKNQLYHNYSEIDDENVASQLSQSDVAFNKRFYGE